MKNRLSTFLWVLVLTSLGTMPLFAQSVHQGSPTSFMYLQGQPWVEPRYGSNYSTAGTVGVYGLTTTTDGSGEHSHAFVKKLPNGQSDEECAACYGYPGNYGYHQ